MTATPWFDLPPSDQCGWKKHSHVAVIGAGLAGLCAARALIIRGFQVTVYDSAEHCAAGASGSPAGIVKPYITREPSDAMRFHQEAYATLMRWLPELKNNGGFQSIGALQLTDRNYKQNSVYENLTAQASSKVSGVTLKQSCIYFKDAGWLSVKQLCNSLLQDILNRGGAFKAQHKLDTLTWHAPQDSWALSFDHTPTVFSKQVVLANGASLTKFSQLSEVDLIPARGQISTFDRTFELNTVVSGQHYAIPGASSVWVGASFYRGNNSDIPLAADDRENQSFGNELMPELKKPLQQATDRFVGVRSTTRDRFPVIGPMPDTRSAQSLYHDIRHGRQLSNYPAPTFYPGLAILGGLGSKGIAIAPFAAELLADWTVGGVRLVEQNRIVSPLRFLIKQLKRQPKQ